MKTLRVLFAVSATLLVAGTLVAAPRVIGKPVTGDPGLQSINVIGFAPGGVLLVGDGAGSQIVAIETGDATPAKPLANAIADFDRQLAARLGAKPDGIEILDLAANPASGQVYVAVRKQDDKRYIVATVDGTGEIQEFELDNVRYASVKLSAGDATVSRVTDIAWADDRIVAAGRSNETFASKIFSIAAPLEHEATSRTFSAETYHVSHRRWETKAPMSVIMPYKEKDQTYVIGAFSCTPVVKYPLTSLQPDAQIKGTSVIELGSGNRPIDMFVYKRDGKPFVLANTFRFHHELRPFGPSPYWTVKFEQDILGEQEYVNEKALRRLKENYQPATQRVQMVETYHGVMQMDKLGEDQAVVLRQGEKGISLAVLALP